MYCSLPSARRRLSRSSLYLARSSSTSGIRLVPQHATQDLARRRLRHRVDKGDAAETLVRRNLIGDELLHLVLGGFGIGSQHDVRRRNLTRLVVGQTDDRGVGDLRVREQQRLEFRRRHLEALELDELLETVDDEEVPVGVDV